MPLRLGQLRIGKVDGKHEYLTPLTEREQSIFDAFLMPEAIQPERMNNGDTFFIDGLRGTGKTSFLRWHAEKQRQRGYLTDFILFKTDLTEDQRLNISKEVGISWTDIDPQNMEVSQDFKSAWSWFILHKIGENLKSNPSIVETNSTSSVAKLLRLLGLNEDSVFKKAVGFMPRLEGAQVKIKADVGFFEAELGGDLKREGDQGATTLDALSRRVMTLVGNVKCNIPFYLYFDELEAFYHTSEQNRRDQRMVRDLLFAVASKNDYFRKVGAPIHIIAAVRSEVITAMGSLGQEVDRLEQFLS